MNPEEIKKAMPEPLPKKPKEDEKAVRRQRKWESGLGIFSGELETLREDRC